MTAGDLDSTLLGRLVRPADYVRVLATPMRLRSPHFAVHHLVGRPLPLKRPMARSATAAETSASDPEAHSSSNSPVDPSLSTELSTGFSSEAAKVVDDPLAALVQTPTGGGPFDRWLGLVVPKRHARRAVTRTLVKRQIRTVAAACAPQLEPGLWVVRQRSPFDPKQYPSAASDALKEAARAELRALFDRAVRGERDRFKPRAPGEAPRGKGSKSRAAKPPESPPCAG